MLLITLLLMIGPAILGPLMILLSHKKAMRGVWVTYAVTLIIQFLGAWAIEYIFMITPTWNGMITRNIIGMVIMGIIVGYALLVAVDIDGDYLGYWGIGIGTLFLIPLIIFGVSVGTTKKVANTPTVITTQKNNIPMPKLSVKNAELPVANTVSTVKVQFNNSLSNLKNANVYDIDRVRAQLLNGRMVYVAGLDFSGSYWRYRNYRKTDGYFVIEADKKNAKPKFIKKAMQYTPNAYFGYNADRRLYNAAMNHGYVLADGSPQLEIDEDMHPYYVSTLTKKFGITSNDNYAVKAVAVLDAVTGETKVYNLKNKPKWLDVAVSPRFASQQLEDWATYRNGFINSTSLGSAKGVLEAEGKVGTEGYNRELTPILYKGEIYYFATMTSKKKAQTSAFGYTFTNASTGKIYYYREKDSIMTPKRASSLAVNLMKQTGWKASMPILYEINNQPVWVLSMLDDNAAFRKYVYILANGNGVSDTIAMGDTSMQALENFVNNVGINLDKAGDTNNKPKEQEFTGIVSRVVVDKDSTAFLLQGQEYIFSAKHDTYPMARFIKENDHLSFKGKVQGKNVAIVDNYKNTDIK